MKEPQLLWCMTLIQMQIKLRSQIKSSIALLPHALLLDGSSSAASVMPGNIQRNYNIRLLPGASVEETVNLHQTVVAQVNPSQRG